MNSIIPYLLESGLCIGFFYLIYSVLLQNEVNFKFVRFFLLSGLIISISIPFVNISFPANDAATANKISILLDTLSVQPTIESQSMQKLSFQKIVLIVYFAGLLFHITKLAFQMIQLKHLLNHPSQKIDNNKYIIETDKAISPFSFLNYIFINKEQLNKNGLAEVIAHESAHISQFHTVDAIIAEIICIIQWINPLAWFYKNAIKETHEYLADNKIIELGFNKIKYEQLLVNQALGYQFGMVNNFNKSLTLKRLNMMKKIGTTKSVIIKFAVISPIIAFTLFLFACNETEIEEVNQAKTESVPDKSGVYYTVDEMPEYPGGMNELRKYIAQNIKYPVEAKKNNIQGKVFVKFIVDTNGAVTNVEVAHGADPILDAEAVRVVSEMPEWKAGKNDGKPVKVYFTVPINFALQ